MYIDTIRDYVIIKSSSTTYLGEFQKWIDSKNICDDNIYTFDFYQKGYRCKTYADKSSLLMIHTIHSLMEQNSLKCGLITLSKSGCINSTIRFLAQITKKSEKRYISPMLFTNTLCNMPNALSCMEYDMKAFGNHIFGENDSGIFAIWQACAALEDDLAQEMVVACVESFITPFNTEEILKNENIVCHKGEGSAALLIMSRENAYLNKRSFFASIKGYFFSEDIEVLLTLKEKNHISGIITNCSSIENILQSTGIPYFCTDTIYGNAASLAVNLGIELLEKKTVSWIEKLITGEQVLLFELDREKKWYGVVVEIS